VTNSVGVRLCGKPWGKEFALHSKEVFNEALEPTVERLMGGTSKSHWKRFFFECVWPCGECCTGCHEMPIPVVDFTVKFDLNALPSTYDLIEYDKAEMAKLIDAWKRKGEIKRAIQYLKEKGREAKWLSIGKEFKIELFQIPVDMRVAIPQSESDTIDLIAKLEMELKDGNNEITVSVDSRFHPRPEGLTNTVRFREPLGDDHFRERRLLNRHCVVFISTSMGNPLPLFRGYCVPFQRSDKDPLEKGIAQCFNITYEDDAPKDWFQQKLKPTLSNNLTLQNGCYYVDFTNDHPSHLGMHCELRSKVNGTIHEFVYSYMNR
jgi:hypothetical protein